MQRVVRAAPLWRALSAWLVLPMHFYAMPKYKDLIVNGQGAGYSEKHYDRSTKYLLTINNPIEHGISHESIKLDIEKLKPIYYCLSDEIGGKTHTHHMHVYMTFENGRRIKRIKKTFPTANIKMCKGTHQQCIDYVFKEGEWKNSEKGTTNLRDTHEEYGKRPENHQGKRNDLAAVYEMIKAGKTDEQIFDEYPQYFNKLNDIDRVRTYLKTVNKRKFNYVEVVYICGPTGTGKTSYVMDRFEDDVYRENDYKHMFDKYLGEKVVMLDEFKAEAKIGDMLNYLDGHRFFMSTRFNNKIPEFDKCYIVSNTPFENLYIEEQHNDPKTYAAWIRRFRAWMYFPEVGEPWVSTSYDEYKAGIGISLDEFERIEAEEAITKQLEIEKHQQKVNEKNAQRKKMEEEVAEKLKDEIEELKMLQELSSQNEEENEEDDDEDYEEEYEEDDTIEAEPVEEISSEGEESDEENS